LCALALLAGSACGNLFAPAAAVVDGKKITIDQVDRAFERFASSDQYAQIALQQDTKLIRRQYEQFAGRSSRRAPPSSGSGSPTKRWPRRSSD
jgi:hypothetical protein